jgi:hypothetical protein
VEQVGGPQVGEQRGGVVGEQVEAVLAGIVDFEAACLERGQRGGADIAAGASEEDAFHAVKSG